MAPAGGGQGGGDQGAGGAGGAGDCRKESYGHEEGRSLGRSPVYFTVYICTVSLICYQICIVKALLGETNIVHIFYLLDYLVQYLNPISCNHLKTFHF